MAEPMQRIVVLGDLPDVVVDLPPHITEGGGPAESTHRVVMGYTVGPISQQGDIVGVNLSIRSRHIVGSNGDLTGETAEMRLEFRRVDGVWVCQVDRPFRACSWVLADAL